MEAKGGQKFLKTTARKFTVGVKILKKKVY